MTRLVGVKELAAVLGVSERMGYVLVERGLPHYRVGRQIRLDLDTALRYLQRGDSPEWQEGQPKPALRDTDPIPRERGSGAC
jgi:excisionase family DNA binding protein